AGTFERLVAQAVAFATMSTGVGKRAGDMGNEPMRWPVALHTRKALPWPERSIFTRTENLVVITTFILAGFSGWARHRQKNGRAPGPAPRGERSEEHTSELQSREHSYA